MSGRRRKLVLLIAGVIVVIGARFVLDYVDTRNARRAAASSRLGIPKEQRMILTGGTVDGVDWLENQLRANDGNLVALYILNSMIGTPAENLPEPMPAMGFCGNTPRWERKRLVRQYVKAALLRIEKARKQYFADSARFEFHPLPVIDWEDSMQIEGAFLTAFENENLGMMAVLQDFKAAACMHELVQPSNKSRIEFHRVEGKYDVQQVASSGRRAIAYELVDEAPGNHKGRILWISYNIEDFDGDGLKGITRLRSETDPSQYVPAHGSQPPAPSTDELIRDRKH